MLVVIVLKYNNVLAEVISHLVAPDSLNFHPDFTLENIPLQNRMGFFFMFQHYAEKQD